MTTAQIDRASAEAKRLLNFLAAAPHGIATAESKAVVRQVMLSTGGRLLAYGSDHDIIAKHLGGGVYRVTLSRVS